MARFGYGSSILTSLNLCVLAPWREILLLRLGVRSTFASWREILLWRLCLRSGVLGV